MRPYRVWDVEEKEYIEEVFIGQDGLLYTLNYSHMALLVPGSVYDKWRENYIDYVQQAIDIREHQHEWYTVEFMDQEQEAWMPVLLADLRAENEQLRAIVQEVAEMPQDGYYYNDSTDRMECPFCADSWGWDANVKHTKDHTPECIVTLARALMQKRVVR